MANRDILVLNTTQSRAETQQSSDTVTLRADSSKILSIENSSDQSILSINTSGSAYINDVVADNKVATILDITNHNSSIRILDACLVMLSGDSITDAVDDSTFNVPSKNSTVTGSAILLYNPTINTSLPQITVSSTGGPDSSAEYNLTYNDINGVNQYIPDTARVMICLLYTSDAADE